jgi:hypothetical protein
MDTSLGALRARLFNFRSWDSTGTTLDNRIREAMNVALDRIAGDVPEAIVPDDAHVVLYKDVIGSDASVKATLNTTSDTKVLEFKTTTGGFLVAGTAPWFPDTTGASDGIMHIELPDSKGQYHRRQCREFWSAQIQGGGPLDRYYYVSIDRPWETGTDLLMDFRLYQPEFFVADDVMRVLEPARIYDETRQQIWAIDTGGAYRQDLVDWRGQDKGRPFRFWRGRHFQLPAPTKAPTVAALTGQNGTPWAGPEWEGNFRFCYTYVWGRRDAEWQAAPGGIRDPQWESAPSPVTTFTQTQSSKTFALAITGTNIDAMMDFGETGTLRYSRSGMRIRVYVARDSVDTSTSYGAGFSRVETDGRFYLLGEVEPTTGTFTWDGSDIPDYQRPLKHSTGYYAYSCYPHQDARYEIDLRIQRLPRALLNDQDTVPIQRDAVTAYIELCLHYMALNDGADQSGAAIHKQRYDELAQRLRKRYANPGGVVEPTPLTGYQVRFRYGRFRDV